MAQNSVVFCKYFGEKKNIAIKQHYSCTLNKWEITPIQDGQKRKKIYSSEVNTGAKFCSPITELSKANGFCRPDYTSTKRTGNSINKYQLKQYA